MTLGILGSMVWDLIDHPDAPRVERWGGISYSLAAAAAALPDGWRIHPIIKLGEDLADAALAFLESVPGVEPGPGIAVTPEPNNRVHLRYTDAQHRAECLSGGVPGWRWDELAPRLEGLDALYVNLISGFELDLAAAGRLREAVPPPLYADLHSLLLGMAAHGHRVPRPLDRPRSWLGCFDIVQVNERELGLVAGDAPPMQFARDAVRDGLGAVLVTRGVDGAVRIARGGAPRPWARRPGGEEEPVEIRALPSEEEPVAGDPTGCGDVWGATCFVELVRGARLDEAGRAANRAAARNVRHRGADGLYEHLKGDA